MIILIGIDGMSIPGFQMAATPNMDELVRNGALSFNTRGVMPTVSGPNWASHLMGAGPEQHGVTFNGWTPENIILHPTKTDEKGYFPSVFTVIREQMPRARLGFFYDWDALGEMFNAGNIDRFDFSGFYDETFRKAIPWVLEHRPELTFIYIGNPDEVGHQYKWESAEYVRSLEEVDLAIGELMDALKEARLFDRVHFIVASDHGGIDYGHGGVSMEEIQVPWIISGPGVIRNRMIGQANDNFNTASTIVALLGLRQPWEWIGRPARGAFDGTAMAKENRRVYVPQPFGTIAGGIYDADMALDFTVVPGGYDIRYTLDGSVPDGSSPLWEGPLLLSQSAVVHAAAFDGEHKSMVSSIDYVRVLPVESISLQSPASPLYPGKGPATLIDRQKASGSFTDGKWLGFQSSDLEATLTLREAGEVASIIVGYLYTPGSWIFEPQALTISGSADGKTFNVLGAMDNAAIVDLRAGGRNELTIAFEPVVLKTIKVTATNIGVCPPGHAGEGEPAWLFVDEIMVR